MGNTGNKIEILIFNWHYDIDGNELFNRYEVGEDGVIEIEEHQAMGDGDRWYYDVIFEDGQVHRVFNPNEVIFVPEEEE